VILVRRIVMAAVFVAVLVGGWRFAGSNSAPVTVNYLAGEFSDVALWTVVLVSFCLGAGSVAFFALVERARAALLTRRYRKTVAGLETEVHELRNLALEPEPAAAPSDLVAGSSGTATGRSA
jgi:uncharacterized integral membrane protein